jgi:hypothetical protein
MSKKFAVSRQISVNGNPPIKITYRYHVSAETAEHACGIIAGDWSIALSKFTNYPENLSSTDVVKFIGEYTAEEVSND